MLVSGTAGSRCSNNVLGPFLENLLSWLQDRLSPVEKGPCLSPRSHDNSLFASHWSWVCYMSIPESVRVIRKGKPCRLSPPDTKGWPSHLGESCGIVSQGNWGLFTKRWCNGFWVASKMFITKIVWIEQIYKPKWDAQNQSFIILLNLFTWVDFSSYVPVTLEREIPLVLGHREGEFGLWKGTKRS